MTAIEGFSFDKMVWCVAEHDAFCRFASMFDTVDQAYTVDSIIQSWYPQSAATIFKILDKIAPPKVDSSSEEAYLQLPEDDIGFTTEDTTSEELHSHLPEDKSDFPIEVSSTELESAEE